MVSPFSRATTCALVAIQRPTALGLLLPERAGFAHGHEEYVARRDILKDFRLDLKFAQRVFQQLIRRTQFLRRAHQCHARHEERRPWRGRKVDAVAKAALTDLNKILQDRPFLRQRHPLRAAAHVPDQPLHRGQKARGALRAFNIRQLARLCQEFTDHFVWIALSHTRLLVSGERHEPSSCRSQRRDVYA